MSDEAVRDEFDVDVSRVNPDAFDQQMAAGPILPAGYYHATLDGATRGTTKGNEEEKRLPRAYWNFKFKIVGGVYDGREVEDKLYAPNGNQAMANRVLLFKSRLGLVKRTEDGKSFEPVPGKVDFNDVMDARVIIHVKHEEYTKDDGSKGTAVRLDFNGLHYPDDPKALEKVGKPVEAAKPTTPATAAKAEPAKKQFNTADL